MVLACTIQAGPTDIFRIPGDFLHICIRIEFELVNQVYVQTRVFASVATWISEKGERYVHLLLNRWCSENVHVFVYVLDS